MKYIKNEEDDEEEEVSVDINSTDPFNRSNNRNFVDLATAPALSKLVLAERKKRKKPVKKRTRSNKPRRKKTIDERETALLRYKLRFAKNNTEGQITKLNILYKDPTDKLFNQIYSTKNANRIGDKYQRRVDDKKSILQQENLTALANQRLDRGNDDNGARTRRQVETENRSASRRTLLETMEQLLETMEQQQQAPAPPRSSARGAEHRTADQDQPPPNTPAQPTPAEAPPIANVEFASEPVQAVDFNAALKDGIDRFIFVYKKLNNGRAPHGNMTNRLRTPAEVDQKIREIVRVYEIKQQQIKELKQAADIEQNRGVEESKGEEDIDEEDIDEEEAFAILAMNQERGNNKPMVFREEDISDSDDTMMSDSDSDDTEMPSDDENVMNRL